MQPPLTHVSAPLQKMPSSHCEDDVQSGTQPLAAEHVSFAPHAASLGRCLHTFAVSSQRSVVHGTLSPQLGGATVVQPPLTHVSVPLQKMPSSHCEDEVQSGIQPLAGEHVWFVPHT